MNISSAAVSGSIRRGLRRVVLGAWVALFGALPVHAQVPTPEQIQIFQSLPPDQQQAILDAMQRGGISIPGSTPTPTMQFPQTVLPRTATGELATPTTSLLPGERRIMAGDSIVVDLQVRTTVRTLQPATTTPAGVAPAPGTTAPTSPGVAPAAPSAAPQPAPGAPTTTPPPPPIDRTDEEIAKLDAYVDRVERRNPYKLDEMGRVLLPEVPPIPLAGLTADEATKRLESDPEFRDFELRVTVLPLEPIDVEALKPFGYDLFAGTPTTFAPATDVPVPAEYVVGPGDTLQVQLLGKEPGNYPLVVTRDGTIEFPQLGPVAVAGLTFPEAQALIERKVASEMIGMRASVTMGQLRSIRVFVLGDAERPGSYTVSGLSTITNALFVSGGIKTIGSLRKIELKRGGKTVRKVDLYDLLLRGDTRADVRLQPGDVIFVPPVGPTVSVTGEVNRPAIYELTGPTSAADVVAIAGGLTPRADPRESTVERIETTSARTVMSLDLSAGGRSATIRGGDLLRVPIVGPVYSESVWLNGHSYRTGPVQYRPGLRLTDVIHGVDELQPNADLHYVLIRREDLMTRRVSTISADLLAALSSPQSAANVRLASRDQIFVFDLEGPRDRIVNPILDDLKRQSGPAQPSQVVGVGGSVKVPGQYPLEPGMTINDLIRAGGGLAESAYGTQAELTRYQIIGGERRQIALVEIDLDRARAGHADANVPLLPYDVLVVKELPDWSELERISILGEVKFPGTYPIKRGETLKSVLQRAGGLTDLAFVDGSVFTRKDLRDREKRQLQVLSDRLQRDLAILALQGSQSSPASQVTATLSSGQGLLAELQQTQAVGRLVIDLNQVISADEGSSKDVILKDGDELVVPKRTQEVTVIGEVPNTTSHLWQSGQSLEYYVDQSGGATKQADEKAIYIIRANGSISTSSGGNAWFSHHGSQDVRPGDTIVVPLDAERMRPLPLWTAVTTIIYNLAVAVAAIGSL